MTIAENGHIGGTAKGQLPSQHGYDALFRGDRCRDRTPCCTGRLGTSHKTFNCITVDGDTSTNDMVIAMATHCGQRLHPELKTTPVLQARLNMYAQTRKEDRPRR